MPELTRHRTYIGIDPGKEGGIAYLFPGAAMSPPATWATPMPTTDRDLQCEIDLVPKIHPRIAVVERVHSSPQMGVASAFTFGRGYGALLMALTAAGIPFEEVPPQAWLKGLGIPNKREVGGKEWKRFLRGKAQQLYPDLPLWSEPHSIGRQLAVADALLIATYCQRKHEGKLG